MDLHTFSGEEVTLEAAEANDTLAVVLRYVVCLALKGSEDFCLLQ